MKDALVDTLSALYLVCGGVVVGIVVSELVIMLPLARTLPPADALSVLQFAGFRAWRLAPYSGATAWLSGIAVLALWPWDTISAGTLLTVAGVACWTSAVIVTFTLYLPTDVRIRRLSPDAAPAEMPSLLRRASRFHAVRTTFFTTGFVCFVLGVVLA
jgi:Domain of unknown function (DUF1772)